MTKKRFVTIATIIALTGILFAPGCKKSHHRGVGMGIDNISPSLEALVIENMTLAAEPPDSAQYQHRFEIAKNGDSLRVTLGIGIQVDVANITADLRQLTGEETNNEVTTTSWTQGDEEAIWNNILVARGDYNGDAEVTVTVRDQAGNSANISGTIEIDNTPPFLLSVDPAAGSTPHSGTNITMAFNESLRRETVNVDTNNILLEENGNPVSTEFFWARTEELDDTLVFATDIIKDGVIDNNDLLIEGQTYEINFSDMEIKDLVGNAAAIDIADLLEGADGYAFTIGDSAHPFIDSVVASVKKDTDSNFPDSGLEIYKRGQDKRPRMVPMEKGDTKLRLDITFSDEDGEEIMNKDHGGITIWSAHNWSDLAVGAEKWGNSLDWVNDDTLRLEVNIDKSPWSWLSLFNITEGKDLLFSGWGYLVMLTDFRDANDNRLPEELPMFELTLGSTGGDTTPPQVLSTFPAHNATDVPLEHDIIFVFSESIDPDPDESLNITVRAVDGSPAEFDYVYSEFNFYLTAPESHIYRLLPKESFPSGEEIEVTIGCFKDLAGNVTDGCEGDVGYRFTFTTVAAPDTAGPRIDNVTMPDAIATLPNDGSTAVHPEFFRYSGAVGFVDDITGSPEFVAPLDEINKYAVTVQEVESGVPVKGIFLVPHRSFTQADIFAGGPFAESLRKGIEYRIELNPTEVTDRNGNELTGRNDWTFTTARVNAAPIILPWSLYMALCLPGASYVDFDKEPGNGGASLVTYISLRAIDLDEEDTISGMVADFDISEGNASLSGFTKNLNGLGEDFYGYKTNFIPFYLRAQWGELDLLDFYDSPGAHSSDFHPTTMKATLVDSQNNEVSVTRRVIIWDRDQVQEMIFPLKEGGDETMEVFSGEFVYFEWTQGISDRLDPNLEGLHLTINNQYFLYDVLFWFSNLTVYNTFLNHRDARECTPCSALVSNPEDPEPALMEKNSFCSLNPETFTPTSDERFCFDSVNNTYKLMVSTDQLPSGPSHYTIGNGKRGYGHHFITTSQTGDARASKNVFCVEKEGEKCPRD